MSAPNVFDASKYAVWVVALCVTVLLVLGISGREHDRTLHLAGHEYSLEVANNSAERTKGLSGRDGLGQQSGMLFAYDVTAKRCFWMKDMRFSIDIVWVDPQQKITHIQSRVAPSSYPQTYCADARYVIELPAGTAERHDLRVGRRLTF